MFRWSLEKLSQAHLTPHIGFKDNFGIVRVTGSYAWSSTKRDNICFFFYQNIVNNALAQARSQMRILSNAISVRVLPDINNFRKQYSTISVSSSWLSCGIGHHDLQRTVGHNLLQTLLYTKINDYKNTFIICVGTVNCHGGCPCEFFGCFFVLTGINYQNERDERTLDEIFTEISWNNTNN